MSFGVPLLLLLLLALLPVVTALVWLARWRRTAARRLVQGSGRRVSRGRRLLKAGLLLSSLALLALAAAQQLISGTAIKEGGLAPGTGIGDGIRLAVSSFPTDDQTRSKVMVLVSDGEDLAGSPQDAVKNAVARGVIVHAIGVGTAAGGTIIAPQPAGTAAPRVDPQTGQPATSRLDEGLLRNLAGAGKGRYVDGNGDDAAATI